MCNTNCTAVKTAHITRIGHRAYHLFEEHCAGVVYAVFSSTFYLKASQPAQRSEVANHNQSVSDESQGTQEQTDTGDSVDHPILFCCIGQANLPPGPLNVSTTLSQLPALSVGDTWKSDQGGITIGSFRLTLCQSTVWHPVYKPLSSVPSKAVTKILAQIADTTATPRHSPSEHLNNAISAVLTQSTTQLCRWLPTLNNPGRSTEFPLAMIGCGGGLTPAGDDILVGALVGLYVWNRSVQALLIAEVEKHLSLTSELSAAHILCACDGSAIAPLHNLINAMHTEESTEINDATQRVSITEAARELFQHGHSSGYFAMTGLLVAAQVLNSTDTNDIGGA